MAARSAATHLFGFELLYSVPSERIDVAALRAATLFLGFIYLFLRWERSSTHLQTGDVPAIAIKQRKTVLSTVLLCP
ncbi:hypothetical protein B9G53_08555 [Pseudanabaena sp. SR411]|nr:hypothetical protein B9G53_08555 [Pseudanabaena sp. SR411]